MAKRLQLRRHTDKAGEQASQKGLDRFLGDQSPVTYPETVTEVFCGSELGRTAQTALAACCAHGIRAKVYEADARFGTAEMFADWKERGLLEAMKETGSLLAAVRKILSLEDFRALEEDCVCAVNEMFARVRFEGHGLVYLHSPVVEIVAEACGQDMTGVQLESCEGVMLRQDEDGDICAHSILRAPASSDD